jgi:hypothetical protein
MPAIAIRKKAAPGERRVTLPRSFLVGDAFPRHPIINDRALADAAIKRRESLRQS